MADLLLQENAFLQSVFNAFPAPTFIVDDDVKFLYWNKAACAIVGTNTDAVYNHRGGDVLKCLHSTESPDGCGRAEYCKECLIRNSVGEAIDGNTVYRKHTKMELLTDDSEIINYHTLISTSPFEYNSKKFVLITIEDINELIQLKEIIPICANCKKIRNDDNYWEHVENYFADHIDVHFSHSICPDCKRVLYPELFNKKK